MIDNEQQVTRPVVTERRPSQREVKDLKLEVQRLGDSLIDSESREGLPLFISAGEDGGGGGGPSWSGEVFLRGARWYENARWRTGGAWNVDVTLSTISIGNDSTGTPIYEDDIEGGEKAEYIKISLDPGTTAAQVVSFQTAETYEASVTANSGAAHLRDALWYNVARISGALYVDYPFSTMSFWSETKDFETVQVSSGYVFIGGHTGPFEMLYTRSDMEVTVSTTGHCWLQVLRSNPVLAGASIQYGTNLPNTASTAFHVFRVFSATVDGGVCYITSRNPGDKEVAVALGA